MMVFVISITGNCCASSNVCFLCRLALEQRIVVQRSQSNPEIGDGDAAVLPCVRTGQSRHCSDGHATTTVTTTATMAVPTTPTDLQHHHHQPQHNATTALSPGRSATSPPVPPSPSKIFTRFALVNSNINKFFGNPSSSSSGSTSPTAVVVNSSQTASGGDSRRLRHSSALTPSNTSSSQPNVSGNNSPRPHGSHDGADCDTLPPIRRGRGHTISVMNHASRHPPPTLGTPLSPLSSPPNTVPSATQPRLQKIFSKLWSRPQPGTTTYESRRSGGSNTRVRRGGVTPR